MKLIEVIITKDKILYTLADKIIRPYTMYVIIRENYEHKEFKQGLWELWYTIGSFMNSGLEEEKISKAIEEVAETVAQEYWTYIDSLICEINKYKKDDNEVADQCLIKLEKMKQQGIIDECALEELRRMEEAVY